MDLFSVACITCRAKLSVKQVSAIGQILPCPKCGGMVQIVPPPGWKPPAAATQPTAKKPTAAKQAGATNTNQPAAHSAAAPHSNPSERDPSERDPNQAEAGGAVYTAQLADDDPLARPRGASTGMDRRARLAIVGVAALVSLAIVGFGVWSSFGGSEGDPQAAATDATGSGSASSTTAAATGKAAATSSLSTPVATETSTVGTGTFDGNPSPTAGVPSGTGLATGVPAATGVPLSTGIPAASAPPVGTPATSASMVPAVATPSATGLPNPSAGPSGTPQPTGIAQPTGVAASTGPFAFPAATARATGPAVPPAPAVPQAVDAAARLAEKVPALKFERTPLRAALAVLAEVAGVPLRYDWSTLPLDFRPDDPVSLETEQATLGEVLDKLTKDRGLRVVAAGGVLEVAGAATPAAAPSAVDYLIDDLYGPEAAGAETAERDVRTFVAPETWNVEGGGAIIALPGKLVISQLPPLQQEAALFFNRMRAARGLPARVVAGVAVAAPPAETRVARARALLERPITMNFRPGVPLPTVLAHLEQAIKAPIVVDYGTLAAAGYSVDELVPVSAQNHPLADVLDAFCRPRAWGWYLARDSVIEITTLEAARSRAYVEFYQVRALVGEQSAETFTARLLDATSDLGWKDAGGRMALLFDRSNGILIVRQSSYGHLRLERLLDEWANPGGANPGDAPSAAAGPTATGRPATAGPTGTAPDVLAPPPSSSQPTNR